MYGHPEQNRKVLRKAVWQHISIVFQLPSRAIVSSRHHHYLCHRRVRKRGRRLRRVRSQMGTGFYFWNDGREFLLPPSICSLSLSSAPTALRKERILGISKRFRATHSIDPLYEASLLFFPPFLAYVDPIEGLNRVPERERERKHRVRARRAFPAQSRPLPCLLPAESSLSLRAYSRFLLQTVGAFFTSRTRHDDVRGNPLRRPR